MTWEDILKKVSEREQLDAEEFASDEMGQWRDEKRVIQTERKESDDRKILENYGEKWDKLKEWVNLNKDTEDEDLQNTIKIINVISQKAASTNDADWHKRLWGSARRLLKDLNADWPIHR